MAVHQQYLMYSTWGRPIVSLASSKKDPILIDFVDRHLEQWNLNPSTLDLSLEILRRQFLRMKYWLCLIKLLSSINVNSFTLSEETWKMCPKNSDLTKLVFTLQC